MPVRFRTRQAGPRRLGGLLHTSEGTEKKDGMMLVPLTNQLGYNLSFPLSPLPGHPQAHLWIGKELGRKVPNAWGLHDMLGNVSEWVQDRYGLYSGGSVTDSTGSGSGTRRVHRGGGWSSNAKQSQASDRDLGLAAVPAAWACDCLGSGSSSGPPLRCPNNFLCRGLCPRDMGRVREELTRSLRMVARIPALAAEVRRADEPAQSSSAPPSSS